MSVYSDAILATSNLLSYWRLGEAAGTTAADAKGTNPGTYAGSPTLGATGAIPVDSDTAVTFNGTSQYVSAAIAAHTADILSVEWWQKKGASFAAGTLFCEGTSGIRIYERAAGDDKIVILTANGGTTLWTSTLGYADTDALHHYVVTKNGATLHVYRDGVEISGTAGTNATFAATGTAFIAAVDATGSYFKGTVDEVALYNRALSSTEVAAHYAARGQSLGTASSAGVAAVSATALTIPFSLGLASSADIATVSGTLTIVPGPHAPKGLSGSIEYVIELYDSGATFGPNVRLGELWDARNVGWSRYDRLPGKGFATVSQSSRMLSLLTPLLTHVKVWRISPNEDLLVYWGGFSDYDSSGDDVVLEFYDYKALLSLSRSGYRTMYPTKKLGTEIVTPEWNLAKGATSSPLGWASNGTIEDPVGTDGSTVITTNSQFGTLDQMRLQLFYDLSEMGRANTINQVTFDIDSSGVFSFRKNAGTARNVGLVLGGNVSDYHYVPGWSRYRNDLATLGTTSAGAASEIVKKDTTEAAAKGLRQDVFTIKTLLGIVGAATEADQQQAVTARMLSRATKLQPALALDLIGSWLRPYTDVDVNDTVPVEILNGREDIHESWRCIGWRGTYDEAGEQLSILVNPVLS